MDQWRLVQKLKNMAEQLEVVQRDRQQLINAVAFAKGQAGRIITTATNLDTHITVLKQQESEATNEPIEDPHPLFILSNGLRDVVSTVNQVHAVSSEAEEAHFSAEEAVTAVQAADEPGSDELLQQLIAGEGVM